MTVSPRADSAAPSGFKPLYKLHRHLQLADFDSLAPVLDPARPRRLASAYSVRVDRHDAGLRWHDAIACFTGLDSSPDSTRNAYPGSYPGSVDVLTVAELPGLQIVPRLLDANTQRQLLHDVIADYIPPQAHLNNLDAHYKVDRPLSLFGPNRLYAAKNERESGESGEPGKHPISLAALRAKHLRWVTLGGQYDWTAKVYPSFDRSSPAFPPFPARLAALLSARFDIRPEAAIVNFYSPGDILSPHQDVAELCSADLVSLSLGCDCIFYVGASRTDTPLAIRLRSGDVVVMGGPSRHAFHGVGRVVPDSCPDFLRQPLDDCDAALFDAWISSKRVNINVRQML